MWRSHVLVVLLAAGVLGAHNFTCPENEITGTFGDPDWCDRYWKCFKGTATAVDCDDGLAFEPDRIGLANPCDYIYKVNCAGRETLAEALGTGVCERRNGVYAHEDPNVCDKYYTCEANQPTLLECAPGLHYNPTIKLCDWPADANRGTCETRASLDGFTCDHQDQFTHAGQKKAHPTYPHPEDCTKFYVCKAGRTPAIAGCDQGLVFNNSSRMCDLPKNVPECDPNNTDYLYEDYPEELAAEDTNSLV